MFIATVIGKKAATGMQCVRVSEEMDGEHALLGKDLIQNAVEWIKQLQ
jgi:tRNA G26 N,N-dimethylase Trm1